MKQGESSRLTGKEKVGSLSVALALMNAGDRPYICERTASYLGATARNRFLYYITSLQQ